MMRALKWLLLGGGVGVAAVTAACGKESIIDPDIEQTEPENDSILSDARPASATDLRDIALRRISGATTGAREGDVVFVGLATGRIPSGTMATIVSQRFGDRLTVTLRDGGFDPVPIAALFGDSVLIDVKQSNGMLASFRRAVPAKRRPSVVRTAPARGKSSVPLNMNIRVVFSEPVDPATVTSSTIRVTRGSTSVPGTVRIVDGAGLVAVFVPLSPMAPSANHRLEITTGVRDLSGEALERIASATFTTGTTLVEAPASLRVRPDTVEMTGLTYQMAASVWDAAGNELSDQPVVWSTAGPGISVTESGLVTALAEGEHDVLATLGSLSTSGRIRVRSGGPAVTLTVSPAPGFVPLEDTLLLNATIRDADGRVLARPVTWTSSDPAVASVEPSPLGPRMGAVISHRAGSVAITATSDLLSATSMVDIGAPRAVASMTVSPTSLTIPVEASTSLSVVLHDASGRRVFVRPIVFTSDDPSVATVDASGVVTGLKAGTTSIVATSEAARATIPVTVTALNFKSVVAGRTYSCALTTEGAAWCWGTFAESFAPLIFSSTAPVAVADGLRFESLTAGGNFVCGRTLAGSVYCWGSNYAGALGSTSPSGMTPVLVSGGLTFTSLAGGNLHACGLTASGAAYCWGQNREGQLGSDPLGEGATRFTPVAVKGGHTFRSLIAGNFRTCGLTPAGAAYCWGSNRASDWSANSTTPLAVGGGLVFAALSPGPLQQHTCGVTPTGDAYCWGNNRFGQLGDGLGDGSLRESAAPVPVAGQHSFAETGAGGLHGCGLTLAGTALCWGDNRGGRLGTGTGGFGPVGELDMQPSPTPVAGGLAFASLSVGDDHSCGITTSGVVFCWGRGDYGQLGRGSLESSNVPVRVAGQR